MSENFVSNAVDENAGGFDIWKVVQVRTAVLSPMHYHWDISRPHKAGSRIMASQGKYL